MNSPLTTISANPLLGPLQAPEPVQAQSTDREKLAEAAKQFEAIFLRQMLAAARKADHGNALFSSQGLSTFREMQDNNFAEIAAQTGTLGLAAIIEAQLARQLPAGQ